MGNATFGRNTRDLIEIPGTLRGQRRLTAAPLWARWSSGHPPRLTPLKAALERGPEGLQFRDAREFSSTADHVGTTGYTTANPSGTTTTMALPSNGVIYVDNSLTGSCSGGYVREQRYSGLGAGSPSSCGNAWVSGTYNSDLTIGADNDVIVENNLIAGTTAAARADRQNRSVSPGDHDMNRHGCAKRGSTGGPPVDAAIWPAAPSPHNWFAARRRELTVFGLAPTVRGPSAPVRASISRVPQGVRVTTPALPRAAYFSIRAGLLAISRETEQVPPIQP